MAAIQRRIIEKRNIDKVR
jgi:hypothetical protein